MSNISRQYLVSLFFFVYPVTRYNFLRKNKLLRRRAADKLCGVFIVGILSFPVP